MKMHRRVTSDDVEDYSSHIPRDVITLDQEEDIVYKKGVLTHSEGFSTVKMMQQVDQLFYNAFSTQSVLYYRVMDLTRTPWKETL